MMKKRMLLLIIIVFQSFFFQIFAQKNGSMDFVLDMVHNNPGEKPYVTKYNNGAFLQSEGYDGMVTQWMVNCAITYDNFQKRLLHRNTAERKWIEAQASKIDSLLAELKKSNVKIYPFTDFLVFPKTIWDKYGDQIKGTGKVDGTGGMAERSQKPDIQREMTQKLLRAQIAGIFNRFPQLDGITLRFGETYLHDAPFHMGGNPIREGEVGIKDHVTLLNILRDEICVKRNKKLFYRTWDFGYYFHNDPNYYLAVTNQIKPHPNLIFSIKYQQDDFLRMTPFNPTLGIGKHPQIVEAQSRMEAYGKGAHPYYSAKGVIDGWPETKYIIEFGTHRLTGQVNDVKNPRGIKDILKSGLLRGVMTWSNGGGWQGPYITHEIWTDLNTYVVSHWAQDTLKSEEVLFFEFAKKLGFSPIDAERFRQISLLSIEGVRKGQCNSYTINNVWWARDEFFSVDANNAVIDSILKNNLTEKVLAEKAEASAIWIQIENISKQLSLKDQNLLEAIRVSCSYGRIKYQLIEQMWIMMIENRRSKQAGFLNNRLINIALNKYDVLWQEWHQLKESSKFCATLYTDLAFRNSVKGSIRELVNELRNKVVVPK